MFKASVGLLLIMGLSSIGRGAGIDESAVLHLLDHYPDNAPDILEFKRLDFDRPHLAQYRERVIVAAREDSLCSDLSPQTSERRVADISLIHSLHAIEPGDQKVLAGLVTNAKPATPDGPKRHALYLFTQFGHLEPVAVEAVVNAAHRESNIYSRILAFEAVGTTLSDEEQYGMSVLGKKDLRKTLVNAVHLIRAKIPGELKRLLKHPEKFDVLEQMLGRLYSALLTIEIALKERGLAGEPPGGWYSSGTLAQDESDPFFEKKLRESELLEITMALDYFSRPRQLRRKTLEALLQLAKRNESQFGFVRRRALVLVQTQGQKDLARLFAMLDAGDSASDMMGRIEDCIRLMSYMDPFAEFEKKTTLSDA